MQTFIRKTFSLDQEALDIINWLVKEKMFPSQAIVLKTALRKLKETVIELETHD